MAYVAFPEPGQDKEGSTHVSPETAVKSKSTSIYQYMYIYIYIQYTYIFYVHRNIYESNFAPSWRCESHGWYTLFLSKAKHKRRQKHFHNGCSAKVPAPLPSLSRFYY